MADTNSTVQFKADISQLKAAMQQASRSVRLASSEFKAATAGLDDWSSSAQGLQAKVKQLDSTLQAQRKQVDLAREAWEKTKKVYGENSAEADRAKMSLNNYEAAVAKTEKELNQYSEELKKAEKYGDNYANSLDHMENAQQRASDGFTVMKGALASLVADGIRMTISALKDLAKETIQVGIDFESAMSKVGAVSGASAEDMAKLNEKAKEMGSTTKFTATEAAEAFNYMAMAGWKTEDMLNGIDGIMSLAAASGADLSTTSDIVTDALTAMGYSAQDAGKLADVMAAASSNANTNVEMMGQTFQYAAPIVGALGYNMEDTAVAIGLMANAGIKGEKSGTALRSILTRLSAPPKECAEAMEELGITLTDEQGNMKDLNTVMKDLRKGFDGLSETQQTQYAKAIAGQEAMSGLLAIVNAAPADFDKLTQAVENSNGAAQNMADIMQDNVGGQLTLLKSKVEGIMIKLFEKASDSMKEGINKVSEALDKIDWDAVGDRIAKFATKLIDLFAYLIKNAPDIIVYLKSIGAVIATLFVVNKIAQFATFINGLIDKYKTFKAVLEAVKKSQVALNLAQLASPVGIAITAVAALAAGILLWTKRNVEAKESTIALNEEEEKHINKIHEATQAYQELNERRNESVKAIDAEYGHYAELASELDSLVNANGEVKAGYEDRVNFILTTLNEAFGTEMELIDGVIEGYQEEKKSLEDLMETKKAQAYLSANEEKYTEAIKNQQEALVNYTTVQDDYKNKVEELNQATAERERLQGMTAEAYAKEIGLMGDMGLKNEVYKDAINSAIASEKAHKAAVGELRQSLGEAEQTYVNYQATIKNYEGLSAAIISGDTSKIADALKNLQNDFITAETGTRETLEKQVNNLEQTFIAMRKAVEEGTPGVTQQMVDDMAEMVIQAQEELEKLPPEAKKNGEKTGKEHSEGVKSTTGDNKEAGKDIGESAVEGEREGASNSNKQGKSTGTEFAKGVGSTSGESQKAGETLSASTVKGEEKSNSASFGTGKGLALLNIQGIASQNSNAFSAGERLASSGKSGTENVDTFSSGQNFGQGFVNGIGSLVNAAWTKAKELAQNAWSGLKKGQQEGSPSKLTYKSGVYFVQGYINGIASEQKNLQKTVKNMVSGVVNELAKMSGFNFDAVAQNASTKFADAMSNKTTYMLNKMQYQNEQKLKEFDKTIEKLEAQRDAEITKLQNEQNSDKNDSKNAQDSAKKASKQRLEALKTRYNDEVKAAKEASSAAQEKLNAQIKKTTDKNQKSALQASLNAEKKALSKKLEALKANYDKATKVEKDSLDKQLANLKSNNDARKKQTEKLIEAIEKDYDKLINTQNSYKDAYSTASSEMLSEFSTAINEYQTKAQALIDDTINGITDRYNQRYDELLSKQNNLIDKLKGAGDLFEVSGAGIMTVNDIKEQTKAIKDYTDKLQKIKQKVSSELFNQIASYDMTEGSAFMDRLLAMSKKDLEAYNQAYTEKMEAAQQAGEKIYKSDFNQIAKDYKAEIKTAFKGLDKELEALGTQTMKGFVTGLTKNTDYMSKEIRIFIKSMVDSFKKELQIKSPSRVMMEIGDYTGEGLVDGLKGTINSVKKVANEMAQSVATPLDDMKSNIGNMKLGLNRENGLAPESTSVVNNYNLVQNNTSPKSLSALETYRARRQQIALIKAMT